MYKRIQFFIKMLLLKPENVNLNCCAGKVWGCRTGIFLYSPIKVKHSITETREANNTKAVCTDIPIHILAFVLYKGQCVPTEQT